MTPAAVHTLVDAARAVVAGRIPAVSAERAGSTWAHSRIADSLTDALQEALKDTDDRPPLTHVAVRVEGAVWSLPKPHRHHHVLRIIHEYSAVKYNDADERDQGFLDASGRYLNRRQAEVSAFMNNQVKDSKLIGSILTSEDLW